MCNNTVRCVRTKEFDPDLSPKHLAHIRYDVVIVSKENFVLRAHKIVLARNRFWRDLFSNLSGAGGVCPAEPVHIFLPDFEYNTIKLYILTFYKEKVGTPTSDVKKLNQLVTALHPEFEIEKLKCRLCKEEMARSEIIRHVTSHIKRSAKNDIEYSKQNSELCRCSFTLPEICKIESDRATLTNGIFNNINCCNDADMVKMIKEHYRRHLRDEFAFLRKICGPNFTIPPENTLYEYADITENAHLNSSSDNCPAAGGRVEYEEDDYSGGMSSPDSHSDQDSHAPHKNGSHPIMEGREPISQSSSRSSIGEEPDRSEQFRCRDCKMTMKSMGGLKKHVISKHIYEDLSRWIEGNHDVDTENFTCKFQFKNSKNCERKFKDKKALLTHLATSHNLVDDYLKSRNDELQNWVDPRSSSRNSSEAMRAQSPGDMRAKSGVSLAESRKSTESERELGEQLKYEQNEEEDGRDDEDSSNCDIWERFKKFEKQQIENSACAEVKDEEMESDENCSENIDDNAKGSGDQDSEDERVTLPPDVLPDHMDVN